jgi:hypothetical protein
MRRRARRGGLAPLGARLGGGLGGLGRLLSRCVGGLVSIVAKEEEGGSVHEYACEHGEARETRREALFVEWRLGGRVQERAEDLRCAVSAGLWVRGGQRESCLCYSRFRQNHPVCRR